MKTTRWNNIWDIGIKGLRGHEKGVESLQISSATEFVRAL
jgi:hypothetical protein